MRVHTHVRDVRCVCACVSGVVACWGRQATHMPSSRTVAPGGSTPDSPVTSLAPSYLRAHTRAGPPLSGGNQDNIIWTVI